jgi:hypothetical protein
MPNIPPVSPILPVAVIRDSGEGVGNDAEAFLAILDEFIRAERVQSPGASPNTAGHDANK